MSNRIVAATAIYGNEYNPLLTLKALTVFEDGNLKTLNQDIQNDLTQFTKEVDLQKLPVIESARISEIGNQNEGLEQ